MRKVLSGTGHIYFAGNLKSCIFAKGKSYTTSSCRTPPGSEGSKGRQL